ncbi:hypothetical protein QYF36_009985 [Acer negundo]|nr:hypothetical protein QYF36_009985 [Acer negundo]
MSRCVPFPPPGFVWNGVRRENTAVEKRRNEEKRKTNKDNEELKERDIRERVCALFPPPTFAWNGVSDEALSGIIKVIREKTAAEMKRKKKEEEEKRRRKKENEELEEGEIKEIVCISSSHKHKKSKKCEKTSSSEHEKHENKLLELERSSCLTEEHEQPNSLMYDSSDNTENVRPKFVTPDKSRLAAASKSMLSTTTFVDDHENVESQFTEFIVNFAPPPAPFMSLMMMIKTGSLRGGCPGEIHLQCPVLATMMIRVPEALLCTRVLDTCLKLITMRCHTQCCSNLNLSMQTCTSVTNFVSNW